MGIKAITGVGLLLAGLAAGPAAAAGIRIVIAVAPPPPPRIEYPRPRPYYPRAVWIPGHWIVRGGWVWVPGCWVRRPYRSVYRMPERWAPRGRVRVWRGGYWNRRGVRDRDRWRH